MSSISRLYTTSFTVKRMEYGGSDLGDNKAQLATQGTFTGHIQQADPRLVASLAQTYKLDFLIWCSRNEDVQVGDELTSGGNKYTVLAVQDNFVGRNQHLELHLRKA